MPRLSIITPTICRPTLKRLCDSVDGQTNGDWEHILMVDVPLIMNPAKRDFVASLSGDPRRTFIRCGKRHRNYGNTCRWNAFDRVRGEYIIYLDDDDYLADSEVFETLSSVTKDWAIFPIMRCNEPWFHDPPGLTKTGSGMFIYKRATGLRYPDSSAYCADGELVEQLKEKFEYEALASVRPLMVYEKRSFGKE